MDPFSGESELLNIQTAFYTHAYQSVLDHDISTLSATNKPTAQILKHRAQIALGQGSQVSSSLSKNKDVTSRSLVALAKNDVTLATELADSSDSEDSTVQICAGTVLAKNGEYAKAVELLSKHQGNLEAVALLVQIHLAQNRVDLALKETAAAKRWAQDSLLINLAEGWTNLRAGGQEKYQASYYVYEELASAPGENKGNSLVGQAVSEVHLGRWDEAGAALAQALEGENVDVEAIANAIVLAYVSGKGREERTGELVEMLRGRDGEHRLLVDVREKSDLFEAAAAKYAPKVAS